MLYMNSRHHLLCILIILCLLPLDVRAQKLGKILNSLPFELGNQWKILPAPSISFRPETDWSLGVSMTATHRQGNANKPQVSVLQLDVIYTLNRQFISDFDFQWRSGDGNWLFRGSDSWSFYPDKYFSETAPDQFETISYKRLELDHQLYRRVGSALYVGLLQHLQSIADVDAPENGIFDQEQTPGFMGGISSGIGIGIMHDRRINPLTPVAGESLINLEARKYLGWLGSNFTFSTMNLDVRYYFALTPDILFAWQTRAMQIWGEAPFRMMGQLGGSDIVRGYHSRQYTGSVLASSQAELRINLLPRVGMVLFGGLGSVSEQWMLLDRHRMHAAAGTGIRIMIDQIDRNNLRVDVAYGETGFAWYFSYGEAF